MEEAEKRHGEQSVRRVLGGEDRAGNVAISEESQDLGSTPSSEQDE